MTEIKEKMCSKCGLLKPLTEFRIRKTRASGFRSQCRDCELHIERQYYQDNKRRIGDRKRAWFLPWSRTPIGQATKMLRRICHKSKKKGIPFNLTLEDIKLPVLCPVLGIAIDYECKDERTNLSSPSLDRRVPELGYVKGNVEVISVKANMIKSCATPEEIMLVARYFGMMS